MSARGKLAPGAPEIAYRDGALAIEQIPLAAIADEVGTPFYAYSSAQIARRYQEFAAGFGALTPSICYSVKANPNLAVIRLLGRLGAGADVVSEGELRRALAAGIPGSRIIFSGVGKTASELEFALASDVHQINVESLPEIEALSAVAQRMGRIAPIAIRINPDVDARTHAKITTGKKENKFGIDLAHARNAYKRAEALPGLRPVGVAVHIGSQLTSLRPFEIAFRRIAELYRTLRTDGMPLERLDLGGGLEKTVTRAQLDSVTTPAQAAAIEHEIQFESAEADRLENDEFTSLERTETQEAALAQARARVELLAAELDGVRTRVAARQQELAAELRAFDAGREAVRAALDPDWLARFDRIAAARNGTGIARAEDQQCTGCRMGVRPQTWNQLREGELLACDSCSRLLYWDPAMAPASKAPQPEAGAPFGPGPGRAVRRPRQAGA